MCFMCLFIIKELVNNVIKVIKFIKIISIIKWILFGISMVKFIILCFFI